MRLQVNSTRNYCVLAAGLIYLIIFAPALQAIEFASSNTQTQLIELYTSEGCSSCPPADRWLSKLKSSPTLWQSIVPVAYHVDYWDYIGWKDRFANPAYAARQRQHAAVGNLKNVYTPGFVVDGMEWRGWFKGEQLPAANSRTPGRLIGQLVGNNVQIEFKPQSEYSQLVATFALLGTDLVSEVKRGENINRTLVHDFAVLNEHSIALNKVAGHAKYQATTTLPLNADVKALAVWVSPGAGLRPIQATGTWLHDTH